MAAGAVSATAFDPWAALAKLRAGRPAPPVAAPFSNFSSFSRQEAADPEIRRDAVAAPISNFSGISSGEAVHSEIQAATDDLPYLAKLAARRRKAIAEGRDFWTAPHALAAMHAHGLDPGEDAERIGQRRLPSWADAALSPLAGDWCACCGKSDRLGGRWWREATAPTGWRCSRCHPAALGMSAVEVVT
jgi:hypothetical protein